MNKILSSVLLVVLMAAVSPVGPGIRRLGAQDIEVQPFRPQEEIAPSPDAARAFSFFSRAWSLRDAGEVASLIPEDGRASVTIEGRGVRGQMSRGQVHALLAGLFAEAERAAFQLSTIHLSDESSAYGVGNWAYQSGGGSPRQRQTVFVVLRQSGPGKWDLSELRIQSAD